MAWDPWEVAEPCNAEELHGVVAADLRFIRSFIKRALVVKPKIALLAEALETKKIAIYAERIGERVSVLNALAMQLQRATKLGDALDRAYQGFCEDFAQSRATVTEGDLEKLAAYQDFFAFAEEVFGIETRIVNQDEDGYIDWTLQDYLGSEAVVYGRLEKANPGWLSDSDFMGARSLYGILDYYGDPEVAEERIAEIRAEDQ